MKIITDTKHKVIIEEDKAVSVDVIEETSHVVITPQLPTEVSLRDCVVTPAGGYDIYDGPLSITPSEEKQTLDTAHKALTGNIVVEPIPSNYGKISWDGSVLTVS